MEKLHTLYRLQCEEDDTSTCVRMHQWVFVGSIMVELALSGCVTKSSYNFPR